MKAFCLTAIIGVFLSECANVLQAQPIQTQFQQINLLKPVSEKTRINANQRLQEFENFRGILDRVEKDEILQPKKLKTSAGNKLKSVSADNQKPDSMIIELWDKTTSQWVCSSKDE